MKFFESRIFFTFNEAITSQIPNTMWTIRYRSGNWCNDCWVVEHNRNILDSNRPGSLSSGSFQHQQALIRCNANYALSGCIQNENKTTMQCTVHHLFEYVHHEIIKIKRVYVEPDWGSAVFCTISFDGAFWMSNRCYDWNVYGAKLGSTGIFNRLFAKFSRSCNGLF